MTIINPVIVKYDQRGIQIQSFGKKVYIPRSIVRTLSNGKSIQDLNLSNREDVSFLLNCLDKLHFEYYYRENEYNSQINFFQVVLNNLSSFLSFNIFD